MSPGANPAAQSHQKTFGYETSSALQRPASWVLGIQQYICVVHRHHHVKALMRCWKCHGLRSWTSPKAKPQNVHYAITLSEVEEEEEEYEEGGEARNT